MYVPAAFAETDTAKLHEFMRRNSFAVLTSNGEGGLVASHLPLLLDADAGPNGHLLGHMARANPQWRDVRGEVMAVFSGPHAYVSPSWYEEEGTVPTWNYVAVHAYGTFHLVEDRDGLLDILRRSVDDLREPEARALAFRRVGPARRDDAQGDRRLPHRDHPAGRQVEAVPEPSGGTAKEGDSGVVRAVGRGFAGGSRYDGRGDEQGRGRPR